MNNMQLAGEKFALGAGETLRIQGYVVYVRGRVSVAHGDGYLTTRRFVFCRKPRMPFGLWKFFRGRKIVFAFALEELLARVRRNTVWAGNRSSVSVTVPNLEYSSARETRRGCSRLAPLSARFVLAVLRAIVES